MYLRRKYSIVKGRKNEYDNLEYGPNKIQVVTGVLGHLGSILSNDRPLKVRIIERDPFSLVIQGSLYHDLPPHPWLNHLSFFQRSRV